MRDLHPAEYSHVQASIIIVPYRRKLSSTSEMQLELEVHADQTVLGHKWCNLNIMYKDTTNLVAARLKSSTNMLNSAFLSKIWRRAGPKLVA